MSTPFTSDRISAQAAPAENARRELQGRLAGLGDLQGKKLSPEQKAKKLRDACEGFESVFIQKMWQEMRNTLPKGGLLQGREEKFWQDMYDQELSKKMTSAGGIGLADMMYAQLSRNLISASRSAAGAGHASGFTPGAAPLLPPAGQEPVAADPKAPQVSPASADPGSAAAVYEGAAPQTGVTETAAMGPDPRSTAAPAAAASARMGDGSSGPRANPPEVEQALAALRAQQGLNTPAQSHIEVLPAGQGVRRQHGPSGLDLARMAQREAGTKLGPATVRPPLQAVRRQPGPAFPAMQAAAGSVPAAGEHAPAPAPQAQPGANPEPQPAAILSTPASSPWSAPASQGGAQSGQDASWASAQAANAQQAHASSAAQAPQIRKVRYTTNIPPKGRSKRSRDVIRTLNTDAGGAGSRAGAGLAAYHAAQAQAQAQAAATAARPAVAQGPSPASGQAAVPGALLQEAQPTQALAAPAAEAGAPAGNGRSGAAGSYAIPPLTAKDLRG